RLAIAFGRRVADDVDWIGARPGGGKHLVEGCDHRVVQPGELSGRFDQIVDRKHTCAAAVAYDQELVAGDRLERSQCLSRGKQLLELINAQKPSAPERGADRRISAPNRT